MISAEFLDQLARFNLVIQKRVTSNYIGARKSINIGHGLTFEDHKQYTPGDDFRRIDWHVYGRTDKLHIRRFEEERSLTIHIITDASTSMKFEKKWDYASMLSVGFAYLTMRENEKFQFSTFSQDVNSFKPKRGRSHLAHMIDEMNNLKVEGESQFLKAMRQIKRTIGSRSLVILISDFLYPIEEIEAGLSLVEKNDVKVVMLLDKKEYDMDYRGEYKLKDSESRSILRTFISPRLSSQYKTRLDEHIGKVRKICIDTHSDFSLITTDKPIFDAFFEVLKDRRLG